jgi:hypothetical protein
VNGTYEITEEMHNDKPIWRKTDCDKTKIQRYNEELWTVHDKRDRIPYYT